MRFTLVKTHQHIHSLLVRVREREHDAIQLDVCEREKVNATPKITQVNARLENALDLHLIHSLPHSKHYI